MRLPLAAFAALAIFSLAPLPSWSHDDAEWIMRDQHRNPAGEWCCGEGDCFVVSGATAVSLPAPGYQLPDGEFVPQAEAQPSPDGRFWRCRRPDGSRRCFFAPPPSS